MSDDKPSDRAIAQAFWPSDSQIQRLRTAPLREICEHGSQTVKCAHCDNIALEDEIADLRAQVDDLRAGQANDDRDYRALTERAERAEAERDALKQDAERYRWLRRNCVRTLGEDGDYELRFRFGHLFRETLDAAIDAARGQENQRGEE